MQEPTRPGSREGRSCWNRASEQNSVKPAGVLATACRQRGPYARREVPAVIAVSHDSKMNLQRKKTPETLNATWAGEHSEQLRSFQSPGMLFLLTLPFIERGYHPCGYL